MNDDLIDRLSGELKPLGRAAVPRRLVLGLTAGAIAAAAVMVPWIGLRADIATAWLDPVFWTKFGYTALMTLTGFWALDRLARPAGSGTGPLLAAVALFVLAGTLGIAQLATATPEDARALVMGGTALVCPFYIVALSLPVLAATTFVVRRLAPTNLTLAGLAAGLVSGGAGAWIYAFHCGENGLPFLAIWYTLGVAIVAAAGALCGRWLLRW